MKSDWFDIVSIVCVFCFCVDLNYKVNIEQARQHWIVDKNEWEDILGDEWNMNK